MITWHEDWAEVFALLFVAIGFILSILLFSPFFSYFTVLIAAGLAGRSFYIRRLKQPILPVVLMVVGFLVGYLVGGFWINRLVVLIIFLIGFFTSYYLHKKKIFTTFKSTGYIK